MKKWPVMHLSTYAKQLRKHGHFFMATNAIIDDPTVDGNMTAIYFAFLRFSAILTDVKAGKDVFGTYVGIKKLSSITGFSDRKINYIIKKLERRGLVRRHRKMFGNSVTELTALATVYPAVYADNPAIDALPTIRDPCVVAQ